MNKNIKCEHYKRSCFIYSLCCKKWYQCRICHDESEDHSLDRFKISKIKCAKCGKIQKPSNKCIQCSNKFADYYCNICHLWDSNKDIYHCDKCGICRSGKNEKMYHCDECNICIPTETKFTHTCVRNSPHNDCPICLEDMFTSTKELMVLNCGHWIHKNCNEKYAEKSYRCPTCKKSMWDMELCWNKINDYMKNIEFPKEFENAKANIICNDCLEKSTVNYSVIHKCLKCNSWNTTLEDLVNN